MIKLFNRIAWLLSFALGLVIFNGGLFFILGVILGVIIKSVFLSETFINDSVKRFRESLKNSSIMAESLEKDEIVENTKLDLLDEDEIEDKNIQGQKEEISVRGEEQVEGGADEYKETTYEPSKFQLFLKEFFATNVLAKIGGILLVIGIMFLMGLIYTKVGEVAKIIIGFTVGFAVYGIGMFLHKKDFKTESMVLFGTSILINYIVILGGRYWIGEGNFLSPGITFMFLLLNTAFSVLTSYIYNSKHILLFSIFFAYFIPILIGKEADEFSVITITGYSLILSVASILISGQKFRQNDLITSKILLYFSIVLGNILILFVPLSGGELKDLSFIVKIIGLNLVTFVNLFFALKNGFTKDIFSIFISIWLATLISHSATFNTTLSLWYFLPIFATSLIFMAISYYLSNRENLEFLYTLGTIFTIIILSIIIQLKGELMVWSIIGITVFGIINYTLPFVNENLKKNNVVSLILGILLGAGFLSYNMYFYGKEYFPGISIGIGFLILAILYFIGGFVLFSKNEKLAQEIKLANTNYIYTFLAIATSLFSIAVALLFSNMPIVIAVIWLFESTILYFVALKLNKKILLIAGNILFAVGIAKCFQVITLNGSKLDYGDLVGITLIFLSLCLNVYLVGLVNNVKMLMRVILTKFMHLVGMLIVLFGVFTIFKLESFIIQLIVALILVGILLFYSNFLKDKFLNISYLGALGLLLLFQTLDSIQQVNSGKIDNLYYLFTIIALAILICKLVTFKDNFMKHILIVIGAYLFIISSVYLYNITDGNIYSLTIYWGILSLVGLHIGIAIKNTYARGIALYILILTLAKISLYDIWASNDFNAIGRIIALLLVGGIMIYISVLYNKSKEINLKKDFNFKG